MKRLILSLLSLLSTIALASIIAPNDAHAWWEKVPTKTGNYCMDDVQDFFAERFPGEKITSKAKFGWSTNWQIWVRSSVCEGYLVFDFAGIEGGQCTIPQYISRTHFLNRVWGYGACADVLPHDEYPRW